LGQLFGGLGWVWVDEMGPWTTLTQLLAASVFNKFSSVLFSMKML